MPASARVAALRVGRSSRRRCSAARGRCAASVPHIMVNSCTGKMGHATAEAVVRAGMELIPYTFCGSSQGVAVSTIAVSGIPVELVSSEHRTKVMLDLKAQYPDLLIIDYTLPSAVNDNAAFYCEHKIPFVMGTTGGDRESLLRTTTESGIYAVIAPQMGKQVVAFQATMESMATNFPGAFQGYTLQVVESHQRTKADTSGTAKAIVSSFAALGVERFEVSDIQKVRTRAEQTELMGVPEEHLDGHAFHTYRLKSPDGTVTFEFQHNVCGRTIYAEGTVDAAKFLYTQVQGGSEQKLFNMIDVLRAGAMR